MEKIINGLKELIDNQYNQTSKQKIIILMQKLANSIAEEKNIEEKIDYVCGEGNICPELSCDFLDLHGNLKNTVWIREENGLRVDLKEFNGLKMVKKERVV